MKMTVSERLGPPLRWAGQRLAAQIADREPPAARAAVLADEAYPSCGRVGRGFESRRSPSGAPASEGFAGVAERYPPPVPERLRDGCTRPPCRSPCRERAAGTHVGAVGADLAD